MSYLAKINAAQGFQGTSRPKLTVGNYNVKVTEAAYGANQSKTGYRGVVKVEVIDGDYETGLSNVYLSEGKTEEQTANNTKPFVDIAVAAGLDITRLDESESWADVHEGIMGIFARAIRNGKLIKATLSIRESKDPEKPYRNLSAPTAPTYEAREATAEEKAAFAAAS